jgi:exosortase/archaeosortase family protein
LLLLVSALPDAVYSLLFCRAPAWIAAAFFHAGVTGATFALASGRVVEVTRECGGSDFFALVCAVLTWRTLRQKGALRGLPLLWFGAWAGTLLVNGMRLIVTVWTRAVAECLLPERYFGAVHLVSGVLVFFPALVLLWWVCIRHDLSGESEAVNKNG